ncbi:hypothetical protein PMI27_003978 [Pseudomonas sp. GM41(2012)]|nr:hypothetical protein PMI27_003978 [Pseudomonas sp. GM41(2012)]
MAGQRCLQTALLAHPCLQTRQLNFIPGDALSTMSQDDKLIDLNAERAKRVHDLNEKRLNEVRQAFEHAMPLGKAKKKPKNKPKKR